MSRLTTSLSDLYKAPGSTYHPRFQYCSVCDLVFHNSIDFDSHACPNLPTPLSVRVSRNSDTLASMFLCSCGSEFNSRFVLQQHITSDLSKHTAVHRSGFRLGENGTKTDVGSKKAFQSSRTASDNTSVAESATETSSVLEKETNENTESSNSATEQQSPESSTERQQPSVPSTESKTDVRKVRKRRVLDIFEDSTLQVTSVGAMYPCATDAVADSYKFWCECGAGFHVLIDVQMHVLDMKKTGTKAEHARSFLKPAKKDSK